MILDDAEIEVYADNSTAPGWVFSIASTPTGAIVTRDQPDNPIFTGDYNNDPFESGVVYRVFAYHPELLPDRRLARVVFDEFGGYRSLSPSEAPDSTGGTSGAPNLDAVAKVGNTTTEVLDIGGLILPDTNEEYPTFNKWPGFVLIGGRLRLTDVSFMGVVRGFVEGFRLFDNLRELFANALKMRLSDLIEVKSTRLNIEAEGNAVNFVRRLYNGLINQDGYFVNDLNQETGEEIRRVLFGVQGNKSGFFNSQDKGVYFQNNDLRLEASSVNATGAPVTARSYTADILSAAPGGFQLAVWVPVDGKYRLGTATLDQLTQAQMPSLQPYLGSSSSGEYQLEDLGCVDAFVDPVEYQDFTLNADTFETTLQHNLQTDGSNIWVEAQLPNGQLANDYISIEYINAEDFIVHRFNPSSTDLVVYLRLKKRNV